MVLQAPGAAHIALQVQRTDRHDAADVLYVHGATFGADLSLYFRFADGSWADALAAAGFHAWGFDFVGFGASGRYPLDGSQPAGRIDEAVHDLERTVTALRERNGDKPVVLVAHSRGAAVAVRYAGDHPREVAALVLFGPIVPRSPAGPSAAPPLASHYPLSAWAQYRRFVEDVPRGQPQVLAEADMQDWAGQFLAADAASGARRPPAVLVPAGPAADIAALWSGQALYDPARVAAPTLLVRGEWDSLCTDADAGRLCAAMTACSVEDVKIPRATHLMHLERQRSELYAVVNRFLVRQQQQLSAG